MTATRGAPVARAMLVELIGAGPRAVQVRPGVPADVLDLAPVLDRLILGLIPADDE